MYVMEPLDKVEAGKYLTDDHRFRISRSGRLKWILEEERSVDCQQQGIYSVLAECRTKWSCEYVLARVRALDKGASNIDEVWRECRHYVGTWHGRMRSSNS